MSAIPARPPRTTRLARTLGLDGNPMRRATDRVMTWIRIAADCTATSPAPRRPATACRLGCSLVDGRTAMDPAQALTGADDAGRSRLLRRGGRKR
jgi:hypothetical protein